MPRSFGRTTVASEDDYSYTDKLSGRRRVFTPKANEAVVTFQEQPSEDVLNEVTRATPLTISQGFDLERGFAAVQTTRDRDLDSATRALLDRPEIANALPAMVDGDGLTRYFLPDELTVQFKPEVGAARAEQLIADQGSRVLFRQRTPGYYTISVPEGRGLFETIRDVSGLPEVAFAEPSEVSFNSALDYLPDDPDFGRLWGLHNTGQTVNGVAGTVDADIDMPAAWDLERGDPRSSWPSSTRAPTSTTPTSRPTCSRAGPRTGTSPTPATPRPTTRTGTAPMCPAPRPGSTTRWG